MINSDNTINYNELLPGLPSVQPAVVRYDYTNSNSTTIITISTHNGHGHVHVHVHVLGILSFTILHTCTCM